MKVAEYIAEVAPWRRGSTDVRSHQPVTGATSTRDARTGCLFVCGVTVQQIRRVHMIGELTKASRPKLDVRRAGSTPPPRLRRCASPVRAALICAPPPPPRPPARLKPPACCASVRRAVH